MRVPGSALTRPPTRPPALATIPTPFDRGTYDGALTASIGTAGVGGLDSLAPQAIATPEEQRLRALPFEDRQRVRMVLPYARRGKGREIALEQFAVSPEVDGSGRGLLWLLSADVHVPGLDPEPRLGDAVALAGMLAVEGNRRRAVLVVLDGTTDPAADTSLHSLPEARRYLQALGVPLFVWRLGVPSGGRASDIGTYRELEKAHKRLRRDLEQQWMIWIEGWWLPNDLEAHEGTAIELLAR